MSVRRWVPLPVSLLLASSLPLLAAGCRPPEPPDAGAGAACEDFEFDVERVWSKESRTRVEAGLIEIDAAHGRVIAERVVTKMDAITRDWVMMQQQICKDTLVRKTMPEEVYTKISVCLLANLAQQRQLVTLASAARPEQVERLETSLIDVAADASGCLDAAVYGYYGTGAREVEARERLAEAELLERFGEAEAAAAAVAQARSGIDGSASLALQVDADNAEARAASARADYAGARALAERAATAAEAGGYELGLADALAVLGDLDGLDGRSEAAKASLERALAIRQRLLGDSVVTADALVAIAYVDLREATYTNSKDAAKAAAERFAQANAMAERVLGPDNLLATTYLADRGLALQLLGEDAAAQGAFERALAAQVAELGEGHPLTANTQFGLARVRVSQGDFAGALALYAEVLATRERYFGPTHPGVAMTYDDVGAAQLQAGDFPAAVAAYAKALEIYRTSFGDAHPLTDNCARAHAYAVQAAGGG